MEGKVFLGNPEAWGINTLPHTKYIKAQDLKILYVEHNNAAGEQCENHHKELNRSNRMRAETK